MSSQFISLSKLVRSFAFPLNVYAWCVLRETGQVRSLHYGFFRDANESIDTAVNRATETLLRLMPPPCRVLEIGVGLGTTLNRLQTEGYFAHGITPDSAQVYAAKTLYGDHLPVTIVNYESFEDKVGKWDLLLFQESSQYIDLLEFFSKASVLLQPRGTILIADEFTLGCDHHSKDNLHSFKHLVSIGQRFGFEVSTQLDMSQAAALTVDVLIHMLTKHLESITHDLGLQKDQVLELISANKRYKEAYSQSRYGYYCLKLERARSPITLPGWIRSQHFKDVQTLFQNVFGKNLSSKVWNWKYGQGYGSAVGVWEGDRLVAHYGGLTRSVLFLGRPCLASQSADVMTAHHARRTLARHSPFFLAAATYLECTTGFGRRHLIGFGFPNVRARKVAELIRLYSAPVGKMLEISWPSGRKSIKSYAVRSRRLDLTCSQDAQLLQACWVQMEESTRCYVVGVRNLEWFNYRYINHPENRYDLHLVHCIWSRIPLGIVVLRQHSDGRCEWVDAIATPAKLSWLVYGIHRIIKDSNAIELFAWVSDTLLPLFSRSVFVTDLEIAIPANGWTDGPDVKSIENRWWLMGGDVDFR